MIPYRLPADMPKEPPDIPKDRNVVVEPSTGQVVMFEALALMTVVAFQFIVFLLIGISLE